MKFTAAYFSEYKNLFRIESFVAYHLQNFIADWGGLIGLFLGISFLSVVNSILTFVVDVFFTHETEASCRCRKRRSKERN